LIKFALHSIEQTILCSAVSLFRRIIRLIIGKASFQNVKFQKISIPIPRKVNGNSKGEGGFKSPIF